MQLHPKLRGVCVFICIVIAETSEECPLRLEMLKTWNLAKHITSAVQTANTKICHSVRNAHTISYKLSMFYTPPPKKNFPWTLSCLLRSLNSKKRQKTTIFEILIHLILWLRFYWMCHHTYIMNHVVFYHHTYNLKPVITNFWGNGWKPRFWHLLPWFIFVPDIISYYNDAPNCSISLCKKSRNFWVTNFSKNDKRTKNYFPVNILPLSNY